MTFAPLHQQQRCIELAEKIINTNSCHLTPKGVTTGSVSSLSSLGISNSQDESPTQANGCFFWENQHILTLVDSWVRCFRGAPYAGEDRADNEEQLVGSLLNTGLIMNLAGYQNIRFI